MHASRALAAFLRRYHADEDAGGVRPVEAYVEAAPEHASAIREAYASLQRAAPDDAPETGPPRRIGPYRLLEAIGSGGQGTVYRAEDTRLEREVAVKVLSPWALGSDAMQERFRREAEIASQLNHPGICPVYEMDVEGEVAYLAMPLFKGTTLAREIAARAARRPVSPDGGAASSAREARAHLHELLACVEGVARALHAAHEAGVVHRDIKPGNLFLTTDGRAVILDFGLARDVDSATRDLTESGQLLGTLPYMSPEQIHGVAEGIDRRTDVYALAVTLYEALTLHVPFDAPTQGQVLRNILLAEPKDPRHYDPTIPRDLKVVLDVALQKERRQRFRTALEFAEELQRVREGRPVRSRPISVATRGLRWMRRNPALAASTLGLFVALGVGLAVALALLADVRQETRAKTAAFAARRAALEEKVLLGDREAAAVLVREQARLYPAREATVPRMDAWLARARDVLGRRRIHEAALETIRARALPFDQAALAHARATRIDDVALVEAHEHVLAALKDAGADAATLAGAEAAVAAARAQRDRRTWTFADPADRLEHEALAALVAALGALEDAVPRVVRRRAYAQSVRGRTVVERAADWAEINAQLRDAERFGHYGGLQIEPQEGLLPLGPDPHSACFEFLVPSIAMRLEPERDPDTGGHRVSPADGIVLVLLPGGMFTMGADAASDAGATGYEGPPHAVALDPFFLSKYELTQAQWWRITREDPSENRWTEGESGHHPVESVSHGECREALARLALHLPTEAQWEYACRAGTTTVFSTGDEPASLVGYANLADAGHDALLSGLPNGVEAGFHDDYGDHAPVGRLLPNAFGLHDMHGNVAEWCLDRYGVYEEPVRAGDGLRRVRSPGLAIVRGGNYLHPAWFARSARRDALQLSTTRKPDVGVRPARPVIGWRR